jgi:pyridoxal biosynthesis lyase PdxS
VTFAAGGIITIANVILTMKLGCDGLFLRVEYLSKIFIISSNSNDCNMAFAARQQKESLTGFFLFIRV